MSVNQRVPKVSVSDLKQRLRAATGCDALTTEKSWLRTYTYVENWRPDVDIAKYDNGGGDHVFVIFTQDGRALIKGFDHNSEMSPHARDAFETWPGIYDGLPHDLAGLLSEEVFESVDVTFCCWCHDGKTWETGTAKIPRDVDDGSGWLLGAIQKDAAQFKEWAISYYGDKFQRIGNERVDLEFGVPRNV